MKTLFRQDQRGVGHAVIVLLAVVVLAGIGFAAYRVLNKDKDSSGTGSSLSRQEKAKVEDECKSDLDDEEFCKFAASFAGTDEYTVVLETSGANGSSTSTSKVKGDDTEMIITDGGNTVAGYVTIGDTSYVLDITDNTWTKTTLDSSISNVAEDLDFDFTDDDTPEAEQTQYKQVGKEACGNLTCFKYQVVDPADTTVEQFLFFDDEDYLLRKWTFSGGEGTTTATFSYDNVEIKAPSPIKE